MFCCQTKICIKTKYIRIYPDRSYKLSNISILKCCWIHLYGPASCDKLLDWNPVSLYSVCNQFLFIITSPKHSYFLWFRKAVFSINYKSAHLKHSCPDSHPKSGFLLNQSPHYQKLLQNKSSFPGFLSSVRLICLLQKLAWRQLTQPFRI
jgi:hypothetical protein